MHEWIWLFIFNVMTSLWVKMWCDVWEQDKVNHSRWKMSSYLTSFNVIDVVSETSLADFDSSLHSFWSFHSSILHVQTWSMKSLFESLHHYEKMSNLELWSAKMILLWPLIETMIFNKTTDTSCIWIWSVSHSWPSFHVSCFQSVISEISFVDWCRDHFFRAWTSKAASSYHSAVSQHHSSLHQTVHLKESETPKCNLVTWCCWTRCICRIMWKASIIFILDFKFK